MANSSERKLVYEYSVEYIENTPVSIDIFNIKHTDMHYHLESIEILYCIKGSVTIICNHETVTLNGGEIFTINPRDIHCVFSDTENMTISFQFNIHDLDSPYDVLEGIYFAAQDHAIQKYQTKALNKIKALLLAMTYNHITEKNNNTIGLTNASNEIANIMIEYFDWFSYMHFNDSQIEVLRERYKQIIKYCHIHFKDKITVTDLAELVHLNNNYTSQFLGKSSYGSFNAMLAFVRCYESQYLLLNTDLPLDEISILCGFSDTKYFYKNFNIWWCKKPKELRDWFKVYSKAENNAPKYDNKDVKAVLESYISEFFSNSLLE